MPNDTEKDDDGPVSKNFPHRRRSLIDDELDAKTEETANIYGIDRKDFQLIDISGWHISESVAPQSKEDQKWSIATIRWTMVQLISFGVAGKED